MKGFIQLDWAAIIDIICINDVKKNIYPTEQNKQEYSSNISFAKLQLEQLKIDIYEIIASDEYTQLYYANKNVFNLIDRIRDGEKMDAAEPDKANLQRYKAKQLIQKKFFNSSLSEFKSKI